MRLTPAALMFAAYAVLIVASVALLWALRRASWLDDPTDTPGGRNDRARLYDEGRVS